LGTTENLKFKAWNEVSGDLLDVVELREGKPIILRDHKGSETLAVFINPSMLKVFQCTGFTDKNNKEIYEHHILRYDQGLFGLVIRYRGSWVVEMSDGSGYRILADDAEHVTLETHRTQKKAKENQ
jgi:hypothetical protein